MQSKPFIIGLIGWLALAVFSVGTYAAAYQQQCYFQASWIFCASQLTPALKVASFILIVGSLACIAYAGYALFGAWRRGEALVGLARYGWIYAVLAMLIVPFGSGDVSYYFSVGKTIASGVNPYIESWTLARPFVAPGHIEAVTEFSYGPITGQLFRLVYEASNNNPFIFIILWKVLVAAALVVAGWLIWKILAKLGVAKTKTSWYLFWIMQPLLIFESLSSGHFDIVWVVFLLLAILSAVSRRWWLVIPLVCVGIWIKFIPLLTLPFFALWWWSDTTKQNWLKNALQAVGGLVLGAGVTLASWAPFWEGFRVFRSVALQSKWAVSSIFADVYYLLKPLAVVLFAERAHWALTRGVHGLLLVTLGYFLWPYIKTGLGIIFKKQTLSDVGFLQMMCIGLLCYLSLWQKSFWPWYPLWLLPLGLIIFEVTKNERWGKLWAWLTVAPLGWYGIWLANWYTRHTDAGNELWFWCAFVVVVWVYPLYQLYILRKNNYNL